MRVQVTQRHCEVPRDVRDHAEERVSGLQKYDPRLSAAEVIFDEVKHQKTVEGILSIDRAPPVVANAEGPDFRAAVDLMVERLAKILRRRRAQAVDHKAPSPKVPDATAPDPVVPDLD